MPREVVLIILGYVIRIIVLILGTYAIRFIKKHELEEWVKFAVQSAEQVFNTPGLGKQKKEYVKTVVKEKFKITDEELDVLIEAKVEELNRLLNIKIK